MPNWHIGPKRKVRTPLNLYVQEVDLVINIPKNLTSSELTMDTNP